MGAGAASRLPAQPDGQALPPVDGDGDGDGLGDGFELALARAYLPHLSDHPDDQCPLSGLVFRARRHPQDPSLVHVVYSRLYQSDCGLGPHPGDNEAFGITVDPSVPAPAGVMSMVAVSHQSTPCQRTTTCGRCEGLHPCDEDGEGRPLLYASKNKHGNVVDIERGCSLTSCLEQCSMNDVEPDLPLVNVGEPDHPLVDDLTDRGFITPDNGWSDETLMHFDPWSALSFGDAGEPAGDLIDDAFVPQACHAAPGDEGEGEGEGEGEAAPVDPFVPAATLLPQGALCDVPADWVDNGGDPTNPPCAIEVDNTIAAGSAEKPALLRVVAWNIRIGHDHAAILQALTMHPELADADVLLLTEVARHDGESVPAGINEARELALALGMNYAFAVEWDRRFAEDAPSPKGEHGAAVLARFPLGALSVVRHTPANDWWEEKHLLGGRLSLGATLKLGDEGVQDLVRVTASHLCTRPLLPNDDARALQGAELRADATLAGRPTAQIAAGDFNTWTCNPLTSDCTQPPRAEQVVREFLDDGWMDGTAGFTGHTQLGEGFVPQRLDWIFHRGPLLATPGTAIEVPGSDHFPLAFDVVP